MNTITIDSLVPTVIINGKEHKTVDVILNTIRVRGYKVSYKYTNRRFKSIYFFDSNVYNKVKALYVK